MYLRKSLSSVHSLNATGRSLTDHIVALSIDEVEPSDSSFAYRTLSTAISPVSMGTESSILLG